MYHVREQPHVFHQDVVNGPATLTSEANIEVYQIPPQPTSSLHIS